MKSTLLLPLGGLLLVGCAHQKPVIYPTSGNAPPAGAQSAIAGCMNKAKAYGLDYSDGQVGKRTAQGGVIGGATGAAAGAVFGHAGRGAAAGAAGGATSSLFSGLFSRSRPNPVYRRFVNKCLRDRGYQPIGWQ